MSKSGEPYGGVRAKVAGLARRVRPARPRLSVVVPVYNVEEYLEGCLDSILAQPVEGLEVVLVDDGSTDASGEVAARYAGRHPHVRLLRQANAGLGAARNAGVAAARGTYLTFADSDDELPPDAWSTMLATLERSGSDFVVGMLKRDDGERRFATPRMRDNHRRARVGVTVAEMPRMLADVFAVNKIFRRSFWDAAGMAFPVGVRYEDQPALTHAFLSARAFDVVRETVYLWRVRSDGSSITQRRDDIADLHDRILTKRASLAMVREAPDHVRHVFLTDILPVDLGEYFRAVPGSSDEYWKLVRAAVEEFWPEQEVPFESCLVPVQVRLMGWLVSQGMRTELEAVAAFLDDHTGALPFTLEDDRVVCMLPGWDDPRFGVPARLYELLPHELRWEARVLAAAWADHELTLSGFALVRNVPTGGRRTTVSLELVDAERAHVDVPTLTTIEPRATRFVGRADQDYDGCGFTATVDLSHLAHAAAPAEGEVRRWELELTRGVDGFCYAGGVTGWDPHVPAPRWHPVDDGHEARVRVEDATLVLELRRT